MSISLLQVAEYYQGLSHQRQALTILEQKIEATNPHWLSDDSEFAMFWRNQGQTAQAFPQVEIISNGTQLRGTWQGETYIIDASELNALVLDTYDPETGDRVDREITGERFVDVSVNPETGHIAVGVFLEYFAATTTSATFIIDLQSGGYAIYRAQVPGDKPFPNEFSTYALSTIEYVRFVEENLFVKHGDAAGNAALVVFKPGSTPAMEYAGCVNLELAEGRGLCSRIGR